MNTEKNPKIGAILTALVLASTAAMTIVERNGHSNQPSRKVEIKK